jgi:hypothetical protein
MMYQLGRSVIELVAHGMEVTMVCAKWPLNYDMEMLQLLTYLTSNRYLQRMQEGFLPDVRQQCGQRRNKIWRMFVLSCYKGVIFSTF